MSGIEIRPLQPSDYADWRRLWTAYLDFYETTRAEEIYLKTWERLLGEGEFEPRGFLALLDGKPVGLVHYLFHRTCWAIGNNCYLQDLYAVPEARGWGVGRALIEAVYGEADKAGAAGVYWLTQEFNHTARKLYDRVGSLTPFVKYQR
jgi:GNAT superfamily N-acetyltransferase